MCWFFVCFKIDPFLSESRAQNFFDLGHFIEEFIRVPLSNSPGNYLKKSLLADTETSMRKCFFMFFFLYPPSFLQKKPSEKWCFSKTVNIPCKGWQKNCSASRVGTCGYHCFSPSKGITCCSEISELTLGIFRRRGGQRQGKCEFPTSLSEVQECSSFFFFFSEDVLVLYGFILFWLGTGKTTKNNLKQNVTYLEQLEKDT